MTTDSLVDEYLARLPTCAQSEYVTSRQLALRSSVRRFAAGLPNETQTLLENSRSILDGPHQTRLILGAIACLFVIGDCDDLPRLRELDGHPEPKVRKAAEVCRFEIKMRGRIPDRPTDKL